MESRLSQFSGLHYCRVEEALSFVPSEPAFGAEPRTSARVKYIRVTDISLVKPHSFFLFSLFTANKVSISFLFHLTSLVETAHLTTHLNQPYLAIIPSAKLFIHLPAPSIPSPTTPKMSVENIIHTQAVEVYTGSHLIPAQPGLTHAYANSTKHGIPMIAISPAQGKFISLLTTMSGARNVLEIGTLGGYSTIWFAQALKANGGGKVTSIEIDPNRRGVAIENLRFAGVKVPEEVDILLGTALDVLPKLAAEIEKGERERFDFVFIDADWPNQWNYFDYGVKLSKGKGSVIYVDNVVRELLESGFVGPKKKDKGAVSLVERVGEDGRVEAVVMQTVGAKDYDGFLMAVVK
jgi:predicted O-methyltransferase YrrM